MPTEALPARPRPNARDGPTRWFGYRRRPTFQPAEQTVGWLFSGPAVVLLTLFIVVPFLLAVGLSFTNQRLLSPLPVRLVGMENYRRIFADPVFQRSLVNNAVFTVVVVPVQTVFALWLAVLVNQKIRFISLFRTAYFAPVVMIMAVAATIWKLLYDPDIGIIDGVLRAVTGGHLSPSWLRSSALALIAVIFMSIWQGVGFQMVVLLAGLQDVDRELYEAAEIDGASQWQQFRYITVPGLRNQLVFVATVTTILSFRLFDQVYVMTRGGPLDATQTMMTRLVDVGFNQQAIARGSAIAVVFFLIVCVVTLVQRLLLREREAD
ncbi:sugar ABC transporter permease [Frankia sp. Cas3]|uniref:carbohydrate ABC transporter permease n=1 Tax=Frankia sp. Cas3 TaxID=3073926 RepID=UPI002AD32942|nr:sugar ABC transporter permease [Frankia sp. Cas3]